MSALHRFIPFRSVLVPVVGGNDPRPALAAARALTEDRNITLVGVVRVGSADSLAAGAAPARELRSLLRELASGTALTVRPRVRVSPTPWEDVVSAVNALNAKLLILEWPATLSALKTSAATALGRPPCDLALVKPPVPAGPLRILVPIRGGPYAELALRVALAMARAGRATVTALHLRPPGQESQSRGDRGYRSIAAALRRMPEVTHREMEVVEAADTVVREARDFDLVVMGATARPPDSEISLGPVASRVLHDGGTGVIVVRTQRPMPAEPEDRTAGQGAVSLLVDKWFAENTYSADEFVDLDDLVRLKRERRETISLALPALNEEETVGGVIRTVKSALMDDVPLLDEIVLIDSDSTDRTREIAAGEGIPVYVHQRILPHLGFRHGKGEALWKSLHVTRGDLVLWIDTDIANVHPRFVYGLVGPLLTNPRIHFVKGFYRRPLLIGGRVEAAGGGRVTELTARPLLNLFFPELSGMIQPLAGEYGGRRSLLENLPFFSGYGVETGLLIDVLSRAGLAAIAQVDLRERIHRNQSLAALGRMAFAIIQVVVRKIEQRSDRPLLDDVNRTMKLILHDADQYFLKVQEIIEYERPAMVHVPEYLEQRAQLLEGQRG